MYRNQHVGVVVLAYDEEGFVGDVIRTLPDYVDLVIAVDDSSSDRTWPEILTAAAASEPTPATTTANERRETHPAVAERAEVGELAGRVLPVRHHENRGAGGAVKTGYLLALERNLDIVVRFDGDGQMDPDIMDRFLDPIVDGQAGYTKGNRLLVREFRRSMPAFRLLGNFMLTFLTKVASGYWRMMDPQNGYTAISRQSLESIAVEDLYEYYGLLNDILVKLNVANVRIADVPMPARYGDEQSGIDYKTFVRRVSVMLLHRFLWRINSQYSGQSRSVLAGYYLGAALTGTSLPILGVTVASVAGWSPLVGLLWAVLAVLVGSGLLVGAMTLDSARNRALEVRPSP
jgi:glycosyltransferase involved in cell wall biosynthesis